MTTDSNLRSGSDLQIGFICQWNRYVRRACFGDNKCQIETLKSSWCFMLGFDQVISLRSGRGSGFLDPRWPLLPLFHHLVHQPNNHTPCSSFLRNAVKSSALLRVEEEGVGVWGTISADAGQTSVGRTFSALNYAPCTRRALHCWKSMHGGLNAMYVPPVTLHWCKASKLRTYVQRKQGLGGLRHFFLFHPADCKKQLFLLKYSSIIYFWGGRGNKWKHLLKLSLLKMC